MNSSNSCANRCLSRGWRDILVASAIVTIVACGGAVTSSTEPSADGGSDGATDGGADGSTTVDASADCASAMEGAKCTHEGESCARGNCSDPCQFCNVLVCMAGVWSSLEAPPEPCTDASARAYPDARLVWQAPGGFAGRGPAIIIDGSGNVLVWSNVAGFGPTGKPTTAPVATFQIDGAMTDSLFSTWIATSTNGLPHAGGDAECSAEIYVTTCANCAPQTLAYDDASRVTPEMNAMWDWFDANLPAMPAAAHTRSYCKF